MKDFLITVWIIIFWILFLWWFLIWLEYYVSRYWSIMDKHQAQECQRAIEYNLKLPYHCNTGSLIN